MKRYYLFLFIGTLLLCFSSEGAWAKGEVTFYAKLKTQVSSSCSNMGKVYAGTSNSAGTYNAPSSTSDELNSGQKESGTTSADVGPFYAFAQENNNYVFEGWKEKDDANADWYSRDKTCQITVTSTAQSSGGYTKTLYAFFSVKKKVTVTMPATENGRYTYSCADGNGTVNTTTAKEITTDAAITLTATPVSGYKFFGWYTLNGTTESFLNYSATYTTTFTSNTTLYAKFIPSSTAVFTLRGTAQYFYDLNTANSAAVASSNKIIVPTVNGTIPAGNYTISGGVTLLIPFDDANTLYTTEPTWPKQAPSGQSAYRKLTLKSGVNIVVNGAISVSAQSQGNQPYGGCVYGKYGQIDMESGSTITINSSANLYCWGYITGGGAITAKSGAKVYEDFQLTCWRGGTAASTMNSNASSKGVFPLAQYYIQNIEAPLTLEAGALEYTCTAVTALSSVWDATVQIVGTNSGLFHISSGSITKWYDAAKDRQMYSINGNTKLGAVVVDVSVTISSEKFVLPITNNMDITIASGTLTCDQRVALLPGARIVIDEGATVKFDSGSKFFIYDKDEWKGSYNGSMVSYNYPGNATHLPAPYSPTCSSIKTLRTFDKMDDAELDVNGTLEMTGALYTTIHGANVRSSNGTGIIKYKTSAGTESVTYQAFQGGSGGTEITWQNISITSAKLHNSTTVTSAYGADLEYLATAGTAANTTITYKNGHWGWMEIWKDADGETVLGATNTIGKVNNAAAKDNLLPTPPTGYEASWETTENDANQEVIHTVVMTKNTFTVTWKDGSTVLKEETLAKNTKPSYDYQKPASEQWVYTMTGWSDGTTTYAADELPLVTKDVTYIAQYDAEPRTYTIRFLNDDNSVLQESAMAYGATPVYNGSEPQSTKEDGSIRAFTGWSPEIVEHSVAADADYTAQYDIVASLLVNDEQTITVNGTVNTTTVQVQGSLTIQEGKTLHTSVLVLESSPDKSGEIIGNMEAEKAYYDYLLSGSASGIWYDVAVPWEVDATTGIFIDGVQKQLNKDFYLIYYNGALRAQQNKHTDACWQLVNQESTPDKYMHPGKLYMIYLPNAGVDTLRFERHGSGLLTVPAIEVSRYDAGNVVNAGWNGIANPAPYKAYLNAGANTVQPNNYASQVPNFGQKYIPANDNYEVFNMSTTPLEAAQPVFVQVSESKTVVLDRTHYPSMAIPARRAIVENAYYEVQIASESNGYDDRLYLMTMADKEDEYAIGLDLAKAGVSTKVAQMWVDRYNTKLCVNTTSPTGTSATYPLGIYAPKDGDYQIYSVTEMQDGQEMFVTYNGRAIWNLAYGPYTATLTAGTHTEYGLKLIQTPATPTGVENVQGDNVQGTKVVIDDHVYIIRGGEVYTITGQKIQ